MKKILLFIILVVALISIAPMIVSTHNTNKPLIQTEIQSFDISLEDEPYIDDIPFDTEKVVNLEET